MEIAQPELGNVGVDQAVLQLSWSWEQGWTLAAASRLSGATTFARQSYEGLSADEALQVAQDVLAEILGLL